MQTHGFPKFFLVSLVQAAVAVNYVFVADAQTRHIAYIIGECLARDIAEVEPSVAAQDACVDVIATGSAGRRAFLESCTPSCFNYEGKRARSLELNDIYVGGGIAYVELLEAWRAAGDMPGMETRGAAPGSVPA